MDVVMIMMKLHIPSLCPPFLPPHPSPPFLFYLSSASFSTIPFPSFPFSPLHFHSFSLLTAPPPPPYTYSFSSSSIPPHRSSSLSFLSHRSHILSPRPFLSSLHFLIPRRSSIFCASLTDSISFNSNPV